MRVLFAAYAVSAIRGSEPGTSWSTASALAERGHDVVVLTSGRFDDEVDEGTLPPNLEVQRVSDEVAPILRRGHVGVYSRYLAWQRRSAERARELLSRVPFDVVHHFSWGSLPWGSPLSLLGVPFVFGPVAGGQRFPAPLLGQLEPPERRREQLRSWLVDQTARNPRARSTLERSTVVIAADSDTAQLISRIRNLSPTMVLPDLTPAALLEHEVPVRPRHRQQVLWVGRALPRKGLDLAIHTISRVDDSVRLDVVGDGPTLPRARETAERLGVSHRVTFHGQLPWNEVRDRYDDADLFLFTSLRDAFGVQLLEAAARGLPIVALNHHGPRDWLPDGAGRLVAPASADALATGLASAVDELLGDGRSWTEASLAARAWAERTTADASARRLESTYREAVAERSVVDPPGHPS